MASFLFMGVICSFLLVRCISMSVPGPLTAGRRLFKGQGGQPGSSRLRLRGRRGSLGQELEDQRDDREYGGRVERRLVVLVFVVQHASDPGADDSCDPPGREEQAVVQAGVLGPPEVRTSRSVHGELGALAPVGGE